MPDFAQVEADQLILNLTNVETFLPEKRALFLEGAEAFATPLQVFYSRRIGNAPTNPTLRSDMAGDGNRPRSWSRSPRPRSSTAPPSWSAT